MTTSVHNHHSIDEGGATAAPAVQAISLAKTYGRGDTRVTALSGLLQKTDVIVS
ncbi:hypothetical protein [Arthrobacter sp. UYCu723]